MADDALTRGELLAADAAPVTGERFELLLRHRGVVVEQILSSALPNGEVYEQEHDEWVVVLDGTAELEIADEPVTLTTGQWVFLPAGVRHRVRSTARGTRWLAVHIHQLRQPAS